MPIGRVLIRYVNFGTRFLKEESDDRPENYCAVEPRYQERRLFRNEIALDVGGVCHGYRGESAWIIDHHFDRGADNFPSASAAVLHKAVALVGYVASLSPPPEVFWLVIHKNPDFDALLAAYLASFLIRFTNHERLPDGSPVDFVAERLHPEGWKDFPPHSQYNPGDRQVDRVAWYLPHTVPGDKRWMLLLAATACHMDNGRPLKCRMEESLPAVFHAAVERGRPYGGTEGAADFFDAARRSIVRDGLNPIWDPLFGRDSQFAPELTLLAGSEAAYRNDLARSRKSIVHLPWTNDFHSYYEECKSIPLFAATGEPDPRHLDTLSPQVAPQAPVPLQVDGLWLRDPECLLFRQYARADRRNSPSGQGFLFTAIAYSGAKSGMPNRSDYYFSLDPERAAGRNLYPVWAALQALEIVNLETAPHCASYLAELRGAAVCRSGYEGREGSKKGQFRDPWFDGSNFDGTLVVTPAKGSAIPGEGVNADLTDDAVAVLVARLLEGRNFVGLVVCRDYAVRAVHAPTQDPSEHKLAAQETAPALAADHVRFVQAELAPEIDLSLAGTAAQAGRQLWQFLYPGAAGGVPTDFLERHLLRDPDIVCVWGRRGIAMAGKQAAAERIDNVERLLKRTVGVTATVEEQIAALKRHTDGTCCQGKPTADLVPGVKRHTDECSSQFAVLLNDADAKLAEIADIHRQLAQPAGRFLYPFYEASRLREVVESVRDVHTALSTRADNQAMHSTLAKIQELEENTEWLEIIVVGVYFLELVHITILPESRQHPWFLVVSWLGGILLILLANLSSAHKGHGSGRRWLHSMMRLGAILWAAGVLFFGLYGLSTEPPKESAAPDKPTRRTPQVSVPAKATAPAEPVGTAPPKR